jgi:hypothetical protein
MVLHWRLPSEGRQRRINTKRASGPPKTIKEKKEKLSPPANFLTSTVRLVIIHFSDIKIYSVPCYISYIPPCEFFSLSFGPIISTLPPG